MKKLLLIADDLRPDATPQDYARLTSDLNNIGATRLLVRLRHENREVARRRAISMTADRLLVVEVAGHVELKPRRR